MKDETRELLNNLVLDGSIEAYTERRPRGRGTATVRASSEGLFVYYSIGIPTLPGEAWVCPHHNRERMGKECKLCDANADAAERPYR